MNKEFELFFVKYSIFLLPGSLSCIPLYLPLFPLIIFDGTNNINYSFFIFSNCFYYITQCYRTQVLFLSKGLHLILILPNVSLSLPFSIRLPQSLLLRSYPQYLLQIPSHSLNISIHLLYCPCPITSLNLPLN